MVYSPGAAYSKTLPTIGMLAIEFILKYSSFFAFMPL